LFAILCKPLGVCDAVGRISVSLFAHGRVPFGLYGQHFPTEAYPRTISFVYIAYLLMRVCGPDRDFVNSRTSLSQVGEDVIPGAFCLRYGRAHSGPFLLRHVRPRP